MDLHAHIHSERLKLVFPSCMYIWRIDMFLKHVFKKKKNTFCSFKNLKLLKILQNSCGQIMGKEQDGEKGDILCADPVFSIQDILPSVF